MIKVNIANKYSPIITCLKKCSYCRSEHEIKREKCPAFGKTCTNCLQKNHFQAVWKFKKQTNKKKTLKDFNNMKLRWKSFQLKTKNKNVNWTKRYIKQKVKINSFDLDTEMDTGRKVMLHHHHHHVVLVARISLTLSRHFSLSFIASGRSSG